MPDELHNAGQGEGHGEGPFCPPPSPPLQAPSPFRPSFLAQPTCLRCSLHLTDPMSHCLSLDLCHFVPGFCPCSSVSLPVPISPDGFTTFSTVSRTVSLCPILSPSDHFSDPPWPSPLHGLCHPLCSKLRKIKRNGTSWFSSVQWNPGGL